MRILHLPSSYFPESVGGTEVYVSTLVAALNELGIQSRVAVHTTGNGGGHEPDELYRLPALDASPRRMLYARGANSTAPGFAELMAQWRPDVVHFHAFTPGAGLPHVNHLLGVKVPYVITYHTPTQSCPRGTLLLNGVRPCDGRLHPTRCSNCVLAGRWPFRMVSGLLSKSRIAPEWLPDFPGLHNLAMPRILATAADAVRFFFKNAAHTIACADFCKAVLVANGVPEEKVSVCRQALPGASRTKRLRLYKGTPELRLGYFGRVTHTKGVDLLPDVIASLQKRGVTASLEILGPIDAAMNSWYRRVVKGTPSIKFRGVLHGEEITKWLDRIDLIVIPSRWLETGPLTLLESWDRCVPVIGADQGGIRDFMIANGLANLLFSPGDVGSMVDAVERFLGLVESPSVSIPGLDDLAVTHAQIYDNAVKGKLRN